MAFLGWSFLRQAVWESPYNFPNQAASYFSWQTLIGVAVMIYGGTVVCLPLRMRLALVLGGLIASVFIFAPVVPTHPGCPLGVTCPVFIIRENIWGSLSYAFLGIGTGTDLRIWVTIASCNQGAELQTWESQGILPSTWSGLACFELLSYPR